MISYNRTVKQRKELRQLLEQRKLKKTSQRELIWSVLLEAKGHPSVEQIRDILLSKGHRIGVATVYRTLKILLASGFVRQSKLQGMTRYEPVIGQPNHLHFICNNCGSNVEFPSRKIESLIKQVTEQQGFDERYSRYAIFGLCKTCVKKEARSAGISERHRLEKTIVRDALELTLAIERRGYTFYTNAARKTKNDGGRLMFQRLAAEESDHLRRLQTEHRTLLLDSPWLKNEPARLPISRKIADDIFPQKALLKIEVKDHTTDLEALNIAMDLERRSHQFFKNFAKQITDARGRKIFLEFAKDEDTHFQSLLSEYNTIAGRHDGK
jgi:Fur family transcriptional regulator, ferric uptake regulator